MQVPIVGQFMHEGIVSLMLAVVGGILMYPIKKIKKAYQELLARVTDTHTELVLQRTNCLSTIQNQGEKQVEILGKVASTLEAIHLDQARLLGRLEK